MKTNSSLAPRIATLALVAATCAHDPYVFAADTAAPAPTVIPVAHSALLTINATPTPEGLALHILHAGNQIPIDGRDVTISVDGKSQPLTVEPEGTFLLATKDLSSDGPQQLDITVAHDGIREILTGKVTLPKATITADLWRDHKQMAWWVLNIGIVMIAVLAFSKRSSQPEKKTSDEEED